MNHWAAISSWTKLKKSRECYGSFWVLKLKIKWEIFIIKLTHSFLYCLPSTRWSISFEVSANPASKRLRSNSFWSAEELLVSVRIIFNSKALCQKKQILRIVSHIIAIIFDGYLTSHRICHKCSKIILK